MGRPAGSKNKPKGCTTISHCLESQVRAQDEDHLERENHNLLSIINGNEEESESEYESEYDDSVFLMLLINFQRLFIHANIFFIQTWLQILRTKYPNFI